MGFVVIRRFRNGEGPAASKSFREEAVARERARTWAREGWEVEFIASGRRETRTVKVTPPREMPRKRLMD